MMGFDRESATLRSALWSAYGDALGFITELAKSSQTIVTRSGHETIGSAIPWRRHIGGIYGPKVELPGGCYSDDTQLRLSTSRCINNEGFFDVEAFAKFELTIWQSYALGGGRGTKAAAQSLTQKNKNWFNNFFNKGKIDYINAGGNGASMRIQPHVWAATELDELNTFIPDVIKNSIVTHGHMRGVLGAVFHAICLSQLLNGRNLTISLLKENAIVCSQLSYFVNQDDFLSDYWLPEWEDKAGIPFDLAVNTVVEELLSDIDLCSEWAEKSEIDYYEMISILKLNTQQQMGSGLKTALAASLLILKMNSVGLQEILFNVVNTLETDTDTIATMFGAMAGVLVQHYPAERIQDQDYILKEAERLYLISVGKAGVSSFSYPDFSEWQPKRVALDYIAKDKNGLVLSGFGPLKILSEEFCDRRSNSYYQWCSTEQGFSVLVKRRNLDELDESNELFEVRFRGEKTVLESELSSRQNELNLEIEPSDKSTLATQLVTDENDIDVLTKMVISSDFDPDLIGSVILKLCKREHYAIESVVAFTSIIAKAKISRDKKANG